jgi:prevent-host-death family protein
VEVGIRDLKNNLSRHLNAVKKGETITVTDHGQPFARIERINKVSKFDQLVAEGRITPASQPKGRLREPVKTGGSVLDFIDEQRR